jgi:flagellin
MLSINSNIDSLVAQENLNQSGAALSQAIVQLSSGKRINSAADDAAGLAIATSLDTAINGLNQGVTNANDGVSIVQTASEAVTQITQSLQTIRQIALEAASGTLSPSDQAALQPDVAQQIAEVNRLASQTTYNGINLLNGSAGTLNIQVGTQVGQTVSIDLGQSLSAASMGVAIGGGYAYVSAGTALGTISGLDLSSSGTENTSGAPGAITAINVLANGNGGYTFTDQNDQALSSTAINNLFATSYYGGALALSLSTSAGNGLSLANEESAIDGAIQAGTLGTLGEISGVSLDPTTGNPVAPGTANAITSLTVVNTAGGVELFDQNGNQVVGLPTLVQQVSQGTLPGASTIGSTTPGNQPLGTALASIEANNVVPNAAAQGAAAGPTTIAAIDVSTTTGANNAVQTVDAALSTIDKIQANLGAVQNRLVGIASSQQDESTDLSAAASQITDADFAQETANLTRAQVLQQAGVSVLAQANSQPQQVLKLLQDS